MNMTRHLTLASYNIQDGIYEDLIIQNILQMAQEGVDVFCLQETRQIKEDFIIDRMKKELGNEWQTETLLGNDNPRLELGLTFLWNAKQLELTTLEKILFPKKDFVGVYDQLIRTFFTPMQRGALIAVFKKNGNLLRITNLHLDMKNGPARRLHHVAYIANHLKKNPMKQEIICGDFNTSVTTTFGKRQKKRIEALFGNDFVDAFPDLKWTFDGASIDESTFYRHVHKLFIKAGFRLYRKLDYIFVKHVRLKSTTQNIMPGSDHYPLIITFEV